MKREPWHPADYEDKHIAALKALRDGKATELQQQLALAWIVNSASSVGDQSFYAGTDGDRITSFLEGRRSVGNQILKLLEIRPTNKEVGNVKRGSGGAG